MQIDSELNHYRITAKLGEGGMGEVYRATDTKLGRDVAIKVLAADVAENPERLARFEREARAVAALNHPGIVTIYSVEESDGRHFITMELIEGTTLEALIPTGGMPLSAFFELAVPIVAAISTAHDRGIAHRDLKPANIMVTHEGQVKVLDFGLAKPVASGTTADDETKATVGGDLTGEGRVLGTVAYMSPEQAEGKEVDHRSDIFSLGVLFYQMATGLRPFEGQTQLSLLTSIMRDEPVPVMELKPAVPRHLGRIVGRCLAKNPLERYQSSIDLRTELQGLQREIESGEYTAGQSEDMPVAVPVAKIYRTPMVGREEEVAQLFAMLDKAASGSGGLAMIGGEPGVGKTRLAWDILEAARDRGLAAFIGHCYESEGTPPFIPWVEVLEATVRVVPRSRMRELMGDSAPELAKLLPELRRVYPDIPAPLDLPAEEARHYLFKSIHAYVERATRNAPTVLVLDDLHWGEEGTLLLLQYLAPRLAELPLLVIGTYRDVELDVSRPLAKALQQLVRERLAHRIALRRLPEGGVQRMLEALSGAEPPEGLAGVIHHETEGNPFFVEEVYQHLDEQGRLFNEAGNWKTDLSLDGLEVPEGVRLVVGRRLEQLSGESRAILAAAAVVGRRFSYALVEAIETVDAILLLDAIEESERLQLIRPSGTQNRDPAYTFTHELIRQTLLDGLSLPRLQRFHLQIAGAYEKAYARHLEDHATALAHHLYQAGAAADEDKAVRYLGLAASRSLEAGAFEDAEEKLTLALSLLPEWPGKTKATLLLDRGMALRSLSRMEDALADWKQALPVFEEVGDRESIAKLCSDASYCLAWLGRGDEALALAERGLAALGNEVSRDRVRMLCFHAMAVGFKGDVQEALDRIETAWEVATELGDAQMLARAGAIRLYIAWDHMAADQMVAMAAEAEEFARSSGDDWTLADIIALHSIALLYTGQLKEAVRRADEARTVASRVGNSGAEILALRRVELEKVLTGEDPMGWQIGIEEGVRICEEAGLPWKSHFQAAGAVYELSAGNLDGAQRLAELAMQNEVTGTAFTGAEWQARIIVHAFAGAREEVLAMWDEQRESVLTAGDPLTTGMTCRVRGAIEALAMLGEYGAAAPLYPLALRTMRAGVVLPHFNYSMAHNYTGVAAAAAGEWGEAEELFAAALEHARQMPFRSGEADALRWHGKLLLDLGDEGEADRARGMLDQALEIYREIDAPLHVEIVEGILSG
jgi:tetratricopeptide (TPR) repeat protein